MKTIKILSKDRVRSEKGSGKQAKRWRNAGHERAPADQMAKARSGPEFAAPRKREGVSKSAKTPP